MRRELNRTGARSLIVVVFTSTILAVGSSSLGADAQSCLRGAIKVNGAASEVPRTCAGPDWDDHCAAASPWWGQDQVIEGTLDLCISIAEVPDPPDFPPLDSLELPS